MKTNLPNTKNSKFKVGVVNRFPRGIWIMTCIDMLVMLGTSVSFPFLSLYLHDERGVSMSLVGTLFMVSGFSSAAANLIGGMLSDRFGRRKLLFMISGVGVLIYSGLALLIGFNAPIWLIAVVYVAARGVIGMTQPTISAIITDLVPKDRLAESFALVRVGANIGFAIGPAIGGYLRIFLSYGWLLGMAGIACALVTVLVLFFLPESFKGSTERVDVRTTLAVANDHRFLVFNIFCLLLFASMAQLFSTLSIFTVDLLMFSTAQYGLLLTANGIIVTVFQYPVARLMNKLPRHRGLILGSILYAIGYLSLGWVTEFNWALVSITVVTAAEVVFSPIASTVVAESAPHDWRGRYMGFFGLCQSIGISFAPLFGGVLLDVFPAEPRLLWGMIALVGMIPAIGFFWWGRKQFKSHHIIDR